MNRKIHEYAPANQNCPYNQVSYKYDCRVLDSVMPIMVSRRIKDCKTDGKFPTKDNPDTFT